MQVRPPRWPHLLRLLVLVVALAVLFWLVAVARVIDVAAVRDHIRVAGPLAPVLYAATSAVLAAVLVPGPLLAAGSGVLFGPVLGTLVTVASATGTAVLAAGLGRRAGGSSARALLGERRSLVLDGLVARGGLWAVVGQRFVPGISDALASYAFGAFGVPLWQMAAGAVIGSAPRAFVYTALGAAVGDLSGPLAVTAIAVWCVTAVLGAFAARRMYRSWRTRGGDTPTAPG